MKFIMILLIFIAPALSFAADVEPYLTGALWNSVRSGTVFPVYLEFSPKKLGVLHPLERVHTNETGFFSRDYKVRNRLQLFLDPRNGKILLGEYPTSLIVSDS